VVSEVDLFFLSKVSEEGSAVVFPWGFLSAQAVPLTGLQQVLEWLARVSKSWQGSGVKVLPLLCLWTWVEKEVNFLLVLKVWSFQEAYLVDEMGFLGDLGCWGDW